MIPSHMKLDSNRGHFGISEDLKTVLDSSKQALSDSTMGCAKINNVSNFLS